MNNYPGYARMTPENVPPYGGAGGGAHMMMQQHQGMNGPAYGNMPYPPTHGGPPSHPSYGYPSGPPGYYGGPPPQYYHHHHHHPGEDMYYSSYGQHMPPPYPGDMPPGYGHSMMPMHGMPPEHHHHSHHNMMHYTGAPGGIPPQAYDSHAQQQQQNQQQQQIHPSSSAERRLSFPSVVKASSSGDDLTISSSNVGGNSPPGIPAPPTNQSGSLASLTDEKPHTPESLSKLPLRESSNAHSNEDGNSRSEPAASDAALTQSTEKKQTLDTASVLLAFSSTKKPRPNSETDMLDDADSKCSIPTLPADPSFSSMISEAPTVEHFVVPAKHPTRLSTPEDEEKLNALHCYMRSELLELVVIQSASEKTEDTTSRHIPTSSDHQMIGRVGLRCVFCGKSRDGGKSGPSMSIFYPRTVSEIYRLVTSWKRCHLSKCVHLPKSVRETLNEFKDCRARGKTVYWVESAHALGLVDIPTKIGGIRFQTDATGNIIQSASRPSSRGGIQSLLSSDSKISASEDRDTVSATG